MTDHDKAVLRVARHLLKDGAVKIFIGEKIVSRRKIFNKLQTEFPKKEVVIEGNNDLIATDLRREK